jgi:hypothetical protein
MLYIAHILPPWQVRVYYVNPKNQVQELCYSQSTQAWVPGAFNAQNYKAVANSGLLYAISTSKAVVRVGFQDPSVPASITEAEHVEPRGWKSAVLGKA